MTTVYEIPLSGEPQQFFIALSGVTYQLVFIYRDAPCGMGGWMLDINDSFGNPIACGLPLVTGLDMLMQFDYLNFGGELGVLSDGDLWAIPTFDNLGTGSHLYWVTEP
jgi:hypothetical protein